MKKLFGTLPLAAALALTPVGLAQTSDAQPPAARPAVDSYFNAALEYWKIWDALDPELVEIVELAGAETDESGNAAVSEALSKLQPQIQMVIRATQMPLCDWQIDYSQGFDTVLPHLGKIRMTARLLRADAQRLLAEGDVEGATIRGVATVNLSLHASEGGFLIGSLVGIAVGQFSSALSDELLESGKTTQIERDMLLAAFNQIDMDNVYDIIEAIKLERDVAIDWLEKEFTGDDARDVSGLLSYISGEEADEDHPLMNFSDEDVVADLAKLKTAYDDLLNAWNADDANEQFGDINAGVEAGEYGELAKVILPALSNVRKATDKAATTITATKKRISKTKDQDAESDK